MPKYLVQHYSGHFCKGAWSGITTEINIMRKAYFLQSCGSTTSKSSQAWTELWVTFPTRERSSVWWTLNWDNSASCFYTVVTERRKVPSNIWSFKEVESCWKQSVTGSRLWSFIAWPHPPPLLFLLPVRRWNVISLLLGCRGGPTLQLPGLPNYDGLQPLGNCRATWMLFPSNLHFCQGILSQ